MRFSQWLENTMLHKSKGILRYGENSRLVVEVDRGLADYYRSLIPKWREMQPQMHPPHITVVRTGKEEVPNKEFWGKHEGEEIEFFYDPTIKEGTVYYWLNVFSVRLEEIRRELGLPVQSEYTLPPEGYTKCFHMTLANKKERP